MMKTKKLTRKDCKCGCNTLGLEEEKDNRIRELEQERERMLSDERIWERLQKLGYYEEHDGSICNKECSKVWNTKEEAIQAVKKILKGE